MYPEHEKLKLVKEESNALSRFIDWFEEQGMELCNIQPYRFGHEYIPIQKPINKLLAEYFEIDLVRLEDEKEAMLDECRRLHKGVR